MIPLTVIVIAQNEQANILHCLNSVQGWCAELIVVDSFSTDQTAALAQQAGAVVASHTFADWASQRNWALDTLPLQDEWVLFLDADEQATEAFKREAEAALVAVPPDVSAFSVYFDFVFLGRCLRHAYESPPVIRLIRKDKARWRGAGAREYCEVNGRIAEIRSRIRHEDHKGLAAWIEKQNRNATREAQLLWQRAHDTAAKAEEAKTSERHLRVWVRERIWQRLPLFFRSLIYFLYRYVVRGGFLDGQAGLAYTFLQGLWFNFLIDAGYYELQQQNKRAQRLSK